MRSPSGYFMLLSLRQNYSKEKVEFDSTEELNLLSKDCCHTVVAREYRRSIWVIS